MSEFEDTNDCPECLREFVPKREGQVTCGRPACNGGIGARKRVYQKTTRGKNNWASVGRRQR